MQVRIAGDAAHVAERAPERLPEHDAHVFRGMVEIHVQIALGLHFEIEAGMAGEQIEHMVEETDARGNAGAARAVQIDGKAHLGFLGLADDLGLTHGSPLGDGPAPEDRALDPEGRRSIPSQRAGVRFPDRSDDRTPRPRLLAGTVLQRHMAAM